MLQRAQCAATVMQSHTMGKARPWKRVRLHDVMDIREFGFVNPVLLDGSDRIIAGHGRVLAAQALGMPDVPTVRVDHLTPAQVRAYVIADNKLAENAGWDRALLALELQELSVTMNFDVTITGFEPGEIDILIGEQSAGVPDEADLIPEIDRAVPAISRPGDLWRIGEHYLLCGDALDSTSYKTVLRSQRAQMVFVDPPYNVPIAGNVSGLGKAKHREFTMASGEMTSRQFTTFLQRVFEHLTSYSTDGSIHFVCMDWRHMGEVLEAGNSQFAELKNLCVWTKTNGGMGSLYRSQHELVFVFKNGTGRHINNVELGRFGRNRTNVWDYAGVNTFGKNREEELAMHPTVKPLALVSDAIMDCSKRGGIVLDAFAGSGTTLLAAEKTGRHGRGIELDPHYVDTIIRRFEDVFDLQALHVSLNRDFKGVRDLRAEKVHDDEQTKSTAAKKEKKVSPLKNKRKRSTRSAR